MKLKIQFESGCLGHVIVVCSTILVIALALINRFL
jgi:hypothetical protein